MKKIINRIILCIATIVFVVAAYNIYKIETEYGKAVDEYRDLSQDVFEVQTASADTADTSEKAETAVSDNKGPQLEDIAYPRIKIDFDDLQSKNSDLVGWLLMQKLGISYPIAQSTDNEFYLHHTFEGTKNTSGCIFLDSVNKPDLTDLNSFVYGHNMKNGSMFGSLKKLYQNDDIYTSDPYFYIYTRSCVYKYKIYSYYTTPPDSDAYNYVNNEEEYGQYEKMVLGWSLRDCGVNVTTDRPTVTLSTCSGTGAAKKRFLVHGILIGKHEGDMTVLK